MLSRTEFKQIMRNNTEQDWQEYFLAQYEATKIDADNGDILAKIILKEMEAEMEEELCYA